MEKDGNFDKSQLLEALKDEHPVIKGRRDRKRRSRFLTQIESVRDSVEVAHENQRQQSITTTVRHSIKVVAKKPNNVPVKPISTIDRIFETEVYRKHVENQHSANYEKQKERAKSYGQKITKVAGTDVSSTLKRSNNPEKIVRPAKHIPDKQKLKEQNSQATTSNNTKKSLKVVPKTIIERTESLSESTNSSSDSRKAYKREYANWLKTVYAYYNHECSNPRNYGHGIRPSNPNNYSTGYLNPSRRGSHYSNLGYYGSGYSNQDYQGPGYLNPGYQGSTYSNPGYQGSVYANLGYQGSAYLNPSYQDSPGYSNPGYQGSPGYSNPGYQGSPGYSNPGYQGSPGYSNLGYEGSPGYSNPGYQGPPGYSNPGYQGSAVHSNPGYREPGYSNPGYVPPYSTPNYYGPRYPDLNPEQQQYHRQHAGYPSSLAPSLIPSLPSYNYGPNLQFRQESQYPPASEYIDPYWQRPVTFSTPLEYRIPTAKTNKRSKKESKKQTRDKEYKSENTNRKVRLSEDGEGKAARNNRKSEISSEIRKREEESQHQNFGESRSRNVGKRSRPIIPKDSNDNVLDINNNTRSNDKFISQPSRSKKFIEIENGWREQSFNIQVAEIPETTAPEDTENFEATAPENTENEKPMIDRDDLRLKLAPKLISRKTGRTRMTIGLGRRRILSVYSTYTSDSDITDSNMDLLQDFNQRGDEWLAYSESDPSFDAANKLQDKTEENPQAPIRDVEEECQALMEATNPLFKCMKASGRMPLIMIIEDRCMKFSLDRRSANFYIFCITTFIISFLTLLLVDGIAEIFFFEPPYIFYEQIQKLEMDKYWCMTMVTLIHMLYVIFWSLAIIFGNGVHLAEFLTRWNLSVITTKYSVVDVGVRKHILGEGIAFFLYCFILGILFIGDFVPAVRGASGLIAMSILRPFVFRVRLHKYYLCFQVFGLLVHLYVVFCSRVITVLLLTYCKILENYSRRWNLRLAYRLEKLGRVKNGQIFQYCKEIPYMKLFAEHLIASSFLRHTGSVFGVAILSYFIFKAFELIMVLYHCASYVLKGMPRFNDTHVEGIDSEAVPVPYADSDAMIIGSAYFYLFLSIFGCIFTTELIRNSSWALVCGYGFIRRHGLALCKTSMERRFILSLQNMFAPRVKFSIAPGIDGTFVLFFWAMVITFWIFLLQFSPERLQKETITVCNSDGACYQLRFYKGSSVGNQIIDDLINQHGSNITITGGRPKWPCRKIHSYAGATEPPPELYKKCAMTNPPVFSPYLVDFYIPLLFDENMQGIPPFQDANFVDVPCPLTKYIFDGPYTHVKTNVVRNCAGAKVDISTTKRDDCNNLQMTTFNHLTKRVESSALHYQKLSDNSGTGSKIACCYEYNGFTTKDREQHEQSLNCNVPNLSPLNVYLRCTEDVIQRRTNLPYSKLITEEGYVLLSHHREILNDCICNNFPDPTSTAAAANQKCQDLIDVSKSLNLKKREAFVSLCELTIGTTFTFYYPLLFNEQGKQIHPLKVVCNAVGVYNPDRNWAYLENNAYDALKTEFYDYDGNRISESGKAPVVKDDCGNLNVGVPGIDGFQFKLVMLKATITGTTKGMLVCCLDYSTLQTTGNPLRPDSALMQVDFPNQVDKYCNVLPEMKAFQDRCAVRFSRAPTNKPEIETAFENEIPNFDNITPDQRRDWTPCICHRSTSWHKLNEYGKATITAKCKSLLQTWEPPPALPAP